MKVKCDETLCESNGELNNCNKQEEPVHFFANVTHAAESNIFSFAAATQINSFSRVGQCLHQMSSRVVLLGFILQGYTEVSCVKRAS